MSLSVMHSQEFKAQRWIRLDFLRFWFVESWAPATASAAAAGKEEQGMQISFKMLADFRQKLQHDQEVPCPPCFHFTTPCLGVILLRLNPRCLCPPIFFSTKMWPCGIIA
jgi:hypothetical protein